jgi:hypothetical protein
MKENDKGDNETNSENEKFDQNDVSNESYEEVSSDSTPTPVANDDSSSGDSDEGGDGDGEGNAGEGGNEDATPTPTPTPTTDPIAELELKLTELEERINSVSGSVSGMKPLLDRNVALLFPSGSIGNNYRYGGIFHAFNSRIRQLEQRIKTVENRVNNNTNQINRNRNSIAHNAHNIAINVRDIASNLAKINIIKYIDSYWNKKIDGPYEPQLPYIINRKNTAYDYHIEIFVATDRYINNNLNRHGNNGWMLIHMSVVDEYIGTARFIFKKLKTPVGNVRFNYLCLRYENYWPENFTRLLRQYNAQGYDYSFESPFTQSYTVALLTKIIY